jgi:predicted aspartyl protease
LIARGLTVVLLLLGLAACAADPQGGSNACAFVSKGEIDVRYIGGEPIADVAIDGHVVSMLIDTGAERSVLTDATAKALDLAPDYHMVYQINGLAGGMNSAHPVVVHAMTVGGVTIHPDSIALIPGSSGILSTPAYRGVGGVLGLDVLGRYDLDLDLSRQRIVLMAPRRCPEGGPPWTGRAAAPAAVNQSVVLGNFVFSVQLDGHPVAAIIDSGATGSVVSFEAAKAAGVDTAALQADRAVPVAGMNKTGVQTRVHRFQLLDIGGLVIADPRLGVQDLVYPGATMVLGEDLLRRHRVYISYSSRRVFIAP